MRRNLTSTIKSAIVFSDVMAIQIMNIQYTEITVLAIFTTPNSIFVRIADIVDTSGIHFRPSRQIAFI